MRYLNFGDDSAAQRFLVHMFLDRDLGQGATIVTFMATNTPFLDPLFLDERLPALGADKDTLLVMHHPLLFHRRLLS